MAHGTADAHDADNKHHHIIPIKTLTMVFGALVALTVITVLTAQVDLGVLNVPLALAIAGTKATLVVAIFMALYYDNRVNTVVFAVGAVFVVVFLSFTLLDTNYRGDLGNVAVETITDEERRAEELEAREPDPENLRVAPADFGEEGQTAGAADDQLPAGGDADQNAEPLEDDPVNPGEPQENENPRGDDGQ